MYEKCSKIKMFPTNARGGGLHTIMVRNKVVSGVYDYGAEYEREGVCDYGAVQGEGVGRAITARNGMGWGSGTMRLRCGTEWVGVSGGACDYDAERYGRRAPYDYGAERGARERSFTGLLDEGLRDAADAHRLPGCCSCRFYTASSAWMGAPLCPKHSTGRTSKR